MPYRFAQDHPDYSDFASGRVLHGIPGAPAFPVRLATEIFQRCLAHRGALGLTGPVTLYDPCSGAAYQLTVLGLLHRPVLQAVLASDIDAGAVRSARQNLDLLNLDGLDRRLAEIREMHRRFGKESHREAVDSALRLRERTVGFGDHPLATEVFQADALDAGALAENLNGRVIDLVLTDVPYGWHSRWQQASSEGEADKPVAQLLSALLKVLSPATVVAIASDKGQKAAHPGYQRLEFFQIGQRRMVILKPAG